jgi:hypothetical protein
MDLNSGMVVSREAGLKVEEKYLDSIVETYRVLLELCVYGGRIKASDMCEPYQQWYPVNCVSTPSYHIGNF